MQATWLLKAAKVGLCMGIAFASFKATKVRWPSMDTKEGSLNSRQFFGHRISLFKSEFPVSFKTPHAFHSPYIKLSVNNLNLYNASFEINTQEDFNHLRFFNGIQENWHLLNTHIKGQIQDTKRTIKDHLILYCFHYNTFDRKGNKNQTMIQLIGDTRLNRYRFSIQSNEKFNPGEREFILKVLELVDEFKAEFNEDFKALSRIAKTGWTVIEASRNDFSLEGSLNREAVNSYIKDILYNGNEG